MQAYGDLFARVYNHLWQDYAKKIAPLIREFYESTPFGVQHKSLLDLCCGTGQLAIHFLEEGYRVVGIDLSEGMLKQARKNTLPYLVAEQARFVQGNAADFLLNETFRLVVSTFDALNHLPDLAALQGCFSSVMKALHDGGYFVFDLNTRTGLANWNHIQLNPGQEFFLINRGIFDNHMDKAWNKITGFIREEGNLYLRFDETVFNTVFEMEQVKGMLEEAGFHGVYFAKGTNLGLPITDPEAEGKVFFVARK